jgi:serine phosphatase RsbU (regulator of sigma subunit)/HAMP domain-containing protein
MLATLKTFLRSTSLVTRALTIVVTILVVILVGVVNQAVDTVRDDRRAYIFDFVSRNAEMLALSTEATLLKEHGLAACRLGDRSLLADNNQRVLSVPTLAGLSRNPEVGEAFFLARLGKLSAICGRSIQQADSASSSPQPFPFSERVFASVPGLLVDGVVLASSTPEILIHPPQFMGDSNQLFEKMFNSYLAGGRRLSTQTIEHDDELIAVSVAEVRNTNLVVFSYQPVAVVEDVVLAMTRELTKVGGILSLAGVLIAGLTLNRLWRPIRQIDAFAQDLAAGRPPQPFRHAWRDEIGGIFASLGAMMIALRRRESELREFNEAQGDLLVLGQQLTFATDAPSMETLVRKYAPSILRIPKDAVRVGLDLLPSSQPADRSSMQVLIEGTQCRAPLVEGSTLFGTLHLEFRTLRPGPLHRTLIRGMSSSLVSAIKGLQLAKSSLEAAVINKEINACEMIQKAIVRLDSAGPLFEIGSCYVPSRNVGGDWAGAYSDSDGRAALYIVDVTGHGLGSAFASSVIAGVINTMHAAQESLPDLKTVLGTLMRVTHESLSKDRGFTLLAIRMDPNRGVLSVLNCGHSNPLVLGPDGKRVPVEHGFNELITSATDTPLNLVECPFVSGSKLIIWTDGLLENAAHAGKKLRSSWLLKEFSSACVHQDGAQSIAERVYGAAAADIPETAETDDVCVVVVKALELPQKERPYA